MSTPRARVMGGPGRPILGSAASGHRVRRPENPATIHESVPVTGENGVVMAVVAVIAEIRVCRNAG